MKLYQKFLTKILSTRRSTLHNADTIKKKKKFDRITTSTMSKGQLNLTQIHAPAQLISKSNHTQGYIPKVLYILHAYSHQSNVKIRFSNTYSRSTSKPKSSVHITISGKSPYRIPQKSIVIRRRWWMPRVNLDASRISLSPRFRGDRQFLKRDTFALDSRCVVNRGLVEVTRDGEGFTAN